MYPRRIGHSMLNDSEKQPFNLTTEQMPQYIVTMKLMKTENKTDCF